jgi:hypothetical protein
MLLVPNCTCTYSVLLPHQLHIILSRLPFKNATLTCNNTAVIPHMICHTISIRNTISLITGLYDCWKSTPGTCEYPYATNNAQNVPSHFILNIHLYLMHTLPGCILLLLIFVHTLFVSNFNNSFLMASIHQLRSHGSGWFHASCQVFGILNTSLYFDGSIFS